MADFQPVRDAVATIESKLAALAAAIDTLKNSTVVQDQIDEIVTSLQEIGDTIDGLISDAEEAATAPAEPPAETPAP